MGHEGQTNSPVLKEVIHLPPLPSPLGEGGGVKFQGRKRGRWRYWKGLLTFLLSLKREVRFSSHKRGKGGDERQWGGNTWVEVASGTWPE